MPTDLALLTFVKFPEPGKVKTRLAAVIGPELATELYHHFIEATFACAGQLKNATQIAAFTPADKASVFRQMFPGERQWLAQVPVPDLGTRMRAAVQTMLQRGYGRVLIIGSDSPDLPASHLNEAAAALPTHDLVLGPAEDGGYYLIGLKSDYAQLFENITWSTASVLQQTLVAAQRLGLRVHLLPPWYDVDDLPTLQRYCLTNDLPAALVARLKPLLAGKLMDWRALLA